MICATFNLSNLQLLLEESRTEHELSPRVHSQLTMTVVSPCVSIAHTFLNDIDHDSVVLSSLGSWRFNILSWFFSLLLSVFHLHIWLLLLCCRLIIILGHGYCFSFLFLGFLPNKWECLLLTDLDSLSDLLLFGHGRLLLLCRCSLRGLKLKHSTSISSSSCRWLIQSKHGISTIPACSCLIIALLRPVAVHAGLSIKKIEGSIDLANWWVILLLLQIG